MKHHIPVLRDAGNYVIAPPVIISTTVASNSVSIIISLPFTYTRFNIEMFNIVPATDDVSFNMTVSKDNGTTYLSTDYWYNSAYMTSLSSSAQEESAGADATSFSLSSLTTGKMLGNDVGESYSGLVQIQHSGDQLSNFCYVGYGLYGASEGTLLNDDFGGLLDPTLANAKITHLKFAMSSGNISQGIFRLIGIN